MKSLMIVFFSIMLLASCGPSRVEVRERPVQPVYVRPVATRANAVYIDGEWVWRRGRYEYIRPHYVTSRHGYKWRPGYWQNTRKGQVWIGGRWIR